MKGLIPGKTPTFALESFKVLSLKLPENETNQQSGSRITWKNLDSDKNVRFKSLLPNNLILIVEIKLNVQNKDI